MSPPRVRRVTAIILTVSAVVCLALTMVAGRQSPVLLAVLFCGWVLLPFAGLALCFGAAERSARRTGVDAAILALSIASVAFYTLIAVRPPPTTKAGPYLLAPGVSWIVVALIAIWIRSVRRRDEDLSG